MENKPMVVLAVRPGERPVLEVLDGSLVSMQKFVGGDIEPIYPFEDEVAIVCNEEGKMCGMPLNRAIYDEEGKVADILVGDFFVCYAPAGSESFLSLPEELIHKYAEVYERPERFFRNPKDDKLIAVKQNATDEYLGVHWEFHNHEDAVDIEFFVCDEYGIYYEDIDWHVVPKDSEEYSNIDTVAKEWAGNLAVGRANAVLGVLKGEPILTVEGQKLYDMFKSEFLDNGDMYNGCIPYNSCLVDGFKMNVFEELVNAGLIQRRECEGFAYELTAEIRDKLDNDRIKTVDEKLSSATERSEVISDKDAKFVDFEKE